MVDRIRTEGLSVAYGTKRALHATDLSFPAGSVSALIGPSGCGKSTFLRCLNRMNDFIVEARVGGRVLLDGFDVYHRSANPVDLRRRVGMVFQKPNPFPKSIYDNVAYGLTLGDRPAPSAEIAARVESALGAAGLWNEVADRLHESALSLSGGQQQRLCIARALAIEPEVLLMDEPTSALDPIATVRIEELVHELRERYTIVIVTHNLQQAARVSDYAAFFFLGEMIESAETKRLFTSPRERKTEDYLTGRFG